MTHTKQTNFTLPELTRSATATRLGLDNTPDLCATCNLQLLIAEVLQPIRDAWGAPIIVSSGYRSEALNRAIGGAQNSDHLFGSAADIHTLADTPEKNQALFALVRQLMASGKINVKQLIDEHHYNWLHISRQDGRTLKRNQVLHLQ